MSYATAPPPVQLNEAVIDCSVAASAGRGAEGISGAAILTEGSRAKTEAFVVTKSVAQATARKIRDSFLYNVGIKRLPCLGGSIHLHYFSSTIFFEVAAGAPSSR